MWVFHFYPQFFIFYTTLVLDLLQSVTVNSRRVFIVYIVEDFVLVFVFCLFLKKENHSQYRCTWFSVSHIVEIVQLYDIIQLKINLCTVTF